jgi:uncharacterized repeat protein (TIGR03803 family)
MAFSVAASAQQLRVLYSFQGHASGQNPGQIVMSGDTIYGVAAGGTARSGMVFQVSKTGPQVLYNFHGGQNDGAAPVGVVLDSFGNVYGTTSDGGPNKSGIVFELTPTGSGQWTESVLYNFGATQVDGETPAAGLVIDGNGNLYGTTQFGGKFGFGTAFELSPGPTGWTETILHDFANKPDGIFPEAPLIFDGLGNLYGETSGGGLFALGTVFELIPDPDGTWDETVIYHFGMNKLDGLSPTGGLTFDTLGNLYGTTVYGGSGCLPESCGMVFQLSPTEQGWSETVLHSFRPQDGDGAFPQAPVTLDANGNLYGTTSAGGAEGRGTIFRLIDHPGRVWTERFYSFTGGDDGAQPESGVVLDPEGNIYGSTEWGGAESQLPKKCPA